MKDSDQNQPITRNVKASRFSTGENGSIPVEEKVCVIREVPVTIDVEGVESFTILCTPVDRLAMAVGFLFTEGVIEKMSDFEIVKECDDDPNVIRARLTSKIPRIDDADRNLLIVSSCGVCGSENLKKRLNSLPAVGDKFNIGAERLREVHTSLHERQILFKACGGTHAAGIFDENGKIISFAEDAGRHNALDKAIGKCLMEGNQTAGRGAVLTSRLSLEMVSKCARAGIELVTAVSAPTSLAIEIADKCNITLCAFVRETRATVFTHPDRIINIGGRSD